MKRRLVSFLGAAACVAVTTTAWAGNPVRSGDHKLKFTVGSAPAKPKKISTLRLVSVGGTVSGQRTTDPATGIVIGLPGFKVKPGSRAKCKLSVLIASKGTGCPAASKVGGGTATADARPTITTPVTAAITLFYGVDDVDVNGKPQTPRPAILAHAFALGVTSEYPFDIGPGKLTLLPGPPPANGMMALFEITGFDVKINKVIVNPARCKGSWRVSDTYTYSSGAKLTATDKVPCKKRK